MKKGMIVAISIFFLAGCSKEALQDNAMQAESQSSKKFSRPESKGYQAHI